MEQDCVSDSVVDLGLKTRCLLDGAETGAAYSAGHEWPRISRQRVHWALASQSEGSPLGRGEARAKSLLAYVHGGAGLGATCGMSRGRDEQSEQARGAASL